MTRLAVTLAALLALPALPAVALAQDGDPLGDPLDPRAADDGVGDVVPLDDDDGGAPAGAEEDPDAPLVTAGVDSGRGRQTGYPMSIVSRPITLGRNMAQLRYTAGVGGLTDKRAYRRRNDEESFRAGGWLEADYGVTNRIQVGLRYGTGTFGEPVTDDGSSYEVGKAFSVEVLYLVTDTIAAQVELPFLVDPFNVGVTLGAPMKFRFTDDFAVFVGEDLITFRITDLVPFVQDQVSNASAVDAKDVGGTDQDAGDITVKGGVIVGLGDNLTFKGTFGVVGADFSQTDAGSPLWGELFYTPSRMLDLGARVGFANLADATDTVTVTGTAAFRL